MEQLSLGIGRELLPDGRGEHLSRTIGLERGGVLAANHRDGHLILSQAGHAKRAHVCVCVRARTIQAGYDTCRVRVRREGKRGRLRPPQNRSSARKVL